MHVDLSVIMTMYFIHEAMHWCLCLSIMWLLWYLDFMQPLTFVYKNFRPLKAIGRSDICVTHVVNRVYIRKTLVHI